MMHVPINIIFADVSVKQKPRYVMNCVSSVDSSDQINATQVNKDRWTADRYISMCYQTPCYMQARCDFHFLASLTQGSELPLVIG